MAEIPRRPTSENPTELGFTPERKMTPWLSPAQLFRTALNVVLSAIFGSYSDKREIQGGLAEDPPGDYSDRSDVWVDFVADLGDAFGPTYAMASLLAAKNLELEGPGGAKVATERGRVLVMGGDEVYPTATVRDYENKTVGPYRAALPFVEDEREAPHLYVLPGNHDWYDGLTGFMRVFCRKQWIGGWQTRQTRSYFSVKLPKGWWLWGIDIQFDSYIDEPQFSYFQKVAEKMQPGDSVLLCTAMPSWSHSAEEGRREAYVTLDYLERKLIRPKGAEVRLALTGDAHHYARYAQTNGSGRPAEGAAQKITAGGGGAFMSATHHLPTDLELPPKESLDPGKTSPPTTWKLQRTFPSNRDSRRLRRHVVRLPFDNAELWGFVGGVHLAYTWMAQASHRKPSERFPQVVSRLSYDDIARGIARSPLAVLVSAGLVRGLVGFTKAEKPALKWGLGVAHSGAQLGAVVASGGAAAGACSALGLSGLGFSAGFVTLVGVGGGLLGCGVMAGYLYVADHFKLNDNELFSAQRIRDWKNFMRLHIADDGTLTVYPVGVDKTPRKWRLRRGGAADDPWFEPVDRQLAARLIEEPIIVRPTAASEAAGATASAGAVTAGASSADGAGGAGQKQ